ncbi:MAG: hypothetical protein KF687_18025 [Cyclobacteriaceae bacterium]|nr:hypothetical protein [Cyclobacteriaceae bacterium]
MNKFEEILKKYLSLFVDQEMYFINDKKNLDLFASNPSNDTEDSIRMKVSSINDEEFRLHVSPNDMIEHLLTLKIDDRLKKGDLTLVEDIAHLNNDPKLNLLHFASAYCNFHRPDVYPIYSEQHFDFYCNYIQRFGLKLDPDKLNTYPVFCAALNDLVERLGLKGKMNYLQLRKFGWLYAEKVVAESKA